MTWLVSRALMAAYENSRCSQGQAVESSAATFSAGAASALSSEINTPQAFWSHDKTMDWLQYSRYGMTFVRLTDDRGEDLLTWFRAVSRARTLASPERERDLQETAPAFGQSLRGSLAKYNPDSSSWKTAQCSLLGDLESSSVTWPRWGTTVGGELFQLPTLVRSMSAKGYGSWPTPTVCGNYNRKGASKTSGDGLATAVAKRPFPTPSAGNEKWNGTIQEWGGSWNWIRSEDPTFARSPLNPTWVEWLMGFPLGWTALDALETPKYPKPQPSPGAPSLET